MNKTSTELIPMRDIEAKLGSVFSLKTALYGFTRPGVYGLLYDSKYSHEKGRWIYTIANIHTGIGGHAEKIEPCIEVDGEFLKNVLWRGAMGIEDYERIGKIILDNFVPESMDANPIMKLGINNLRAYSG